MNQYTGHFAHKESIDYKYVRIVGIFEEDVKVLEAQKLCAACHSQPKAQISPVWSYLGTHEGQFSVDFPPLMWCTSDRTPKRGFPPCF